MGTGSWGLARPPTRILFAAAIALGLAGCYKAKVSVLDENRVAAPFEQFTVTGADEGAKPTNFTRDGKEYVSADGETRVRLMPLTRDWYVVEREDADDFKYNLLKFDWQAGQVTQFDADCGQGGLFSSACVDDFDAYVSQVRADADSGRDKGNTYHMEVGARTDTIQVNAEECDRLAAHARDADRPASVAGATLADLARRSAAAVVACSKAVAAHPGERRYAFQLGRAYYSAHRTQEATTWYSKAAGMGSAAAVNGLGTLADTQGSIGANQKAYQWYRQAAEKGSTAAMINLARLAMNGPPAEQRPEEAQQWLMKLADLNDAEGMNRLGEWYLLQKDGRDSAFAWFEKAEALGNATATFNIALNCGAVGKCGEGVLHWLDLAIARGSADSMDYRSASLDFGWKGPPDHIKAAEFAVMALQRGVARIDGLVTPDGPEADSEEVVHAVQQYLLDRGYLKTIVFDRRSNAFRAAIVACMNDAGS